MSILRKPFFCPKDPFSPTFQVNMHGDRKSNSVSFYMESLQLKRDVDTTKTVILVFSDDWTCLVSKREQTLSRIEWMDGPGYLHFCSWDEIHKPGNKGLRVVVEISYIQKKFEDSEKPADQYRETFRQLLSDGNHADVTFLVKDEKFVAHRLILKTRCSYFKRMFEYGPKVSSANEVKITDVEPEVFKGILKFIYCDALPDYSTDVTPKLLVAAGEYGLEGLKNSCAESMAVNLTSDNVIDYLLLAQNYACDDLLQQAALVFRSNYDEIDYFKLRKLKTSPDLLFRLLEFSHSTHPSCI